MFSALKHWGHLGFIWGEPDDIPPPSGPFYVPENGTDFYVAEDGVGNYIPE